MILVPEPHDRDGELTLAVALDAARAFAEPQAVVEDARRWSRYVGLVDEDVEAVEAFLVEHGVGTDYALGDRDKRRALAEIRDAASTSRYVFIGASPADRRVAKGVGWEFLTASEAAEKAGWRLRSPYSGAEVGGSGGDGRGDGAGGGADGERTGLVGRIRRSLWPF